MSSLAEIWRFRPLILELVRRDLKLRYKNSIGGIAWSLLNPLMQIAVITVLMKFILPTPVKDYSAYLFILFLWNFFQVSLADGCVAIVNNATLVRKVYFPRAILPLATLLGNLFHFAIAFAFTILYFFVLGTYPSHLFVNGVYPGPLRPEIFLVLPVIFFMIVLCLGFSLILAYLNVFYEDVRFIVTALLQLFFYAVPILYPIEQVKAKGVYDIYMLNPVAALLVTYQRALLLPPTVTQKGVQLPAVGVPWGYFSLACVVSTCVLGVGFLLFEHYKWEMVERL
ncbi:MAG: ABC transporter permease [Abitibacteriaceae bacterium]|nr:ABC transporter permease [Abditibacteriaceae bacterium]